MKSPEFRQLNTWFLFLLLVGGLFRLVEPFLTPLCWAIVLAIYFHPLYRKTRQRFERHALAALAWTMLITVLLIVPTALVLPFVIREAISTLSQLPTSEVMDHLRGWMARLPLYNPDFMPLGSLDQTITEASAVIRTWLAEESARVAGNLALALFYLGMTLFALFYFLRDGEKLVGLGSRLTVIDPERYERLVTEISQMVQVTVSTIFVVAGLQGTAGTLIFWCLGVSAPIVSGLSMAITSMVPLFGALLIWFPVSAWFIIKGATIKGLAIGIVGTIVVLAIDNLVRPILIAGRSRLNPLLVLISVLGGLQAFGALGLVLGPVVTAMAVALLHAYLNPPAPPPEQGPAELPEELS